MRFTELKHKKIGIWGTGVEGQAVKEILEYFVPESEVISFTDEDLSPLMSCQVIVKSPGVSLYRPEIEEAMSKGIRFTSGTNIFLSNRSSETKVIAITGTKGKSTTASLLYHTMKNLGYSVSFGGNIGKPLVNILLEKEAPKYVVAEISSYMCADICSNIDISVLLNLYPEHTNWHKTTQRYYGDKISMVASAYKSIINANNTGILSNWNRSIDAIEYNTKQTIHIEHDFFYNGQEKLFKTSHLSLIGEHNKENACAVLSILKQIGLFDLTKAISSFQTFQALPHRLEKILEHNEITFIDDSISTTPETILAALKSYPKNETIVLIAGGVQRAQDFTELANYICQNRHNIHVLGLPDNGQELVSKVLLGNGEASMHTDLESAVSKGIEILSQKKGLILLSPGAPSYNLYKNFEERGNAFKEIALRLTKEKEKEKKEEETIS